MDTERAEVLATEDLPFPENPLRKSGQPPENVPVPANKDQTEKPAEDRPSA